jgi:hypothetical protein
MLNTGLAGLIGLRIYMETKKWMVRSAKEVKVRNAKALRNSSKLKRIFKHALLN